MEKIILNNNIECPLIGIGTFMLSPKDAENSVREAAGADGRAARHGLLSLGGTAVRLRGQGRGYRGQAHRQTQEQR